MKSLFAIGFVLLSSTFAFAGNCHQQAFVQRQVFGHHHNVQEVVEVQRVIVPVRERITVVEHVEVPAERIIVRERVHGGSQRIVERSVTRGNGVNVDVNVRGRNRIGPRR